jgi:hypothetical protein
MLNAIVIAAIFATVFCPFIVIFLAFIEVPVIDSI